MITISQFPLHACSFAELIPTLMKDHFSMTTRWYYASGGVLHMDLEVNAGVHSENLTRLVCDHLGAHKVIYQVNSFPIDVRLREGQQQYVLVPDSNWHKNSTGLVDEDSLQVLLAGLRGYNDSSFVVRLVGDLNGVRCSASVYCRQGDVPKEIPFAFPGMRMAGTSILPSWFYYNETRHSSLLAIPHMFSSLVTGYGNDRQAILEPMTDSDVVIGSLLNDFLGQSLCFSDENFRSSTAIFGAPGYGKTTLMLSLLLQSWKKLNISFLVVDPKQDYRLLKHFIPEMKVINRLHHINPLLPPRGVDPLQWIDVFINLMTISTPIPEDSPLPGYIRYTFIKAIQDRDLSMAHFLELYMRNMTAQHFVGQANNFIISGKNRIEDVFRIFYGQDFMMANKNSSSFDISQLLCQPCVIELGSLPTSDAVSVFCYYITAQIKTFIQRRRQNRITNCLVLEEAHSVLSPIIPEKVRFDIGNLVAEGRGRGLSVMVVDQSPYRLDQSAINICGNVLSFRLTAPCDQEYAAKQLDVAPRELNALRKQRVLVRTNSMYQSEQVHVKVAPELLDRINCD